MADTPVDPDMDSPSFSLWISGPPAAREPLCAALRDRLAARGVQVAPPVPADHEDSTVLSCAAPAAASTAGGGGALLRFDVAAGAGDPHASADRVASLLESRGLLPAADAQAERDEAALLDRLRDLGYL